MPKRFPDVIKKLCAITAILSLFPLLQGHADGLSDYVVPGVAEPVVKLSGIWKINIHPAADFWRQDDLDSNWKDIRVPGECMMQGFPIRHDQPFAYKKRITIPADFERVILQFDGVYSTARVWVNGAFVRDHSGGFTRWECDITPFVVAGETAMLTVKVTDKADEISYAGGYAKHPIGGILRDVHLLALPTRYPKQLTIVTDLDDNYEHAMLRISGKLDDRAKNATIKLHLADPNGKNVALENSVVEINDDDAFVVDNPVQSPDKWDAEHPNLYTLTVSYFENKRLLFQKKYRFGFREIKVDGNKLLVNGAPVKLRGACRHDIHPLLGRVSTPDYELKDVLLAKEANINFIRTSHYPPSDNFLRLCDEQGVYVEDETAVCFVGTHRTKAYRPGATQNDANYTKKYLSQLEEMVQNHKNHPSVIIWSIGNENAFGTNFEKSCEWVKKNDPTRPVIFSYPGKAPDSVKVYDVLSMHYPGLSGDMNQYGKTTTAFSCKAMPVIFDEWAHVACYNLFTIKEDPNIRDFWGQSLDSMWAKTFEAAGGLGGAIWGMIDETFMLPDSLPGFNEWWGKTDKHIIPAEYAGKTVGYGEWGIVDTWRRKKPEFWNTKKAYSPVKLLRTMFALPTGDALDVPVYNRFNHSNLAELTMRYSYGDYVGVLNPGNIKPHATGTLSIPLHHWIRGEPISVEFLDAKDRCIDKYMLSFKAENSAAEKASTAKVRISEDEHHLTLICENDARIIFDKTTGLIENIQNLHDALSLRGPFLNLRTKGESINYAYYQINNYGAGWKLTDFRVKQDDGKAIVSVKGKCRDIPSVAFEMSVSADGKIKAKYKATGIPKEYIREIGVKFELEDVVDSLSWRRDAYWSLYPANYLSAPEGQISLYSHVPQIYRKAPQKEWPFDTKSFYYDGTDDDSTGKRLTFTAKATKENIREYHLYANGRKLLSVLGDGDVSCRIAKQKDKFILFVNNKMDYVDLGWGNFQRNILLDDSYSDSVVLKMNARSGDDKSEKNIMQP